MMISEHELAQIYETHLERLYRFFYSRVLDKHTAEDLTSETFVAFVDHCRHQDQMEQPERYLYGIAKNIFLKYLRRKYSEPAAVSLEQLQDDFGYYVKCEVHEYEDKETLEERVAQLLVQLPEKQQRILRMRLLDKLTPTEIARQLGMSLNYVKTTQKRAVKSLKKMIACTP
jgi:RNA polymerase sigma-70 factor (ECF subfamily)